MTVDTLAPSTNEQQVAWDNPATWSSGNVPDGSAVSVVLPASATSVDGNYVVGIATAESYEVGSVADSGQSLQIGGTLAIDGDLQLGNAASVTLENGTLKVGGTTTIDSSSMLTGSGFMSGAVALDGEISVSPEGDESPYLFVGGPVTGSGTLAIGTSTDGQTDILELGSSAAVPVVFGSPGGALYLDEPQLFTGSITTTTLPYAGGGAGEDDVLLGGIAAADVTSFTCGGDAQGGLITVVGDGKTVNLDVVGTHSLDDFDLVAGPQSGSGNPSVILQIAPALLAPTLGLGLSDGTTTTDAIVNTGALVVSGTIPAGAYLGVIADGTTVESSTTDLIGGIPSFARPYSFGLINPLAPGMHELEATATGVAGSASSDPLDLLVLPDPVDGITTADVSSFQFASVLDGGATMNFVAGTEQVRLTDGTLSVGPNTVQASVQRLYEGLLGRAADPGGLAQFSGLAAASGDAAVATAILGSPEFAALHGAPAGMSDTQLVTLLYQRLLGRAPDAGGLASHVAALQGGAASGDVAAGIADSGEARARDADLTSNLWVPDPTGAAVTALYETAFDRAPDEGGLAQFTNGLQGGLTLAQVAADLAASPEFLADHAGQSNADLVRSLYANGLGRAPSAADLQGWAGQPAATILLGVAASPEAKAYLIQTV